MQFFRKQLNLLIEFLPPALLIIENFLRSVQVMQGRGKNLRVVYNQLVALDKSLDFSQDSEYISKFLSLNSNHKYQVYGYIDRLLEEESENE